MIHARPRLGKEFYRHFSTGIVAHETPLWEAWSQKHFPMPSEPGKSE